MSRLLQQPAPSSRPSSDAPAVPRGRPQPSGLPQRALAGFATTMNELFGPRETAAFGILMYHRVTDTIPGVAEPTWNVSPARFEQQLAGLLQRGFEAWPLRELLAQHREGRPIPRKAFAITFDDAYENVYLHAFPILRQLELPATVFLATAYLDSPDPFPSDGPRLRPGGRAVGLGDCRAGRCATEGSGLQLAAGNAGVWRVQFVDGVGHGGGDAAAAARGLFSAEDGAV